MSAIKRIFYYLSRTTDYFICYSNGDNSKLYVYVDGNWGGCQQRFDFFTAYIFFKN